MTLKKGIDTTWIVSGIGFKLIFWEDPDNPKNIVDYKGGTINESILNFLSENGFNVSEININSERNEYWETILIPGLDEYQISNYGRVKRVGRQVNRLDTLRIIKDRQITIRKSSNGSRFVILDNKLENKKKRYSIDRLLFESFGKKNKFFIKKNLANNWLKTRAVSIDMLPMLLDEYADYKYSEIKKNIEDYRKAVLLIINQNKEFYKLFSIELLDQFLEIEK